MTDEWFRTKGYVETSPGVWTHPSRVPAKVGHSPLRPTNPQRSKGSAHKRVLQRKKASPDAAARGPRFRVEYRVYAVRPCDFDNYAIKYIQDGLCAAGLLPGDSWDTLQGEVISQKVHSKLEERTEVTIKIV